MVGLVCVCSLLSLFLLFNGWFLFVFLEGCSWLWFIRVVLVCGLFCLMIAPVRVLFIVVFVCVFDGCSSLRFVIPVIVLVCVC